MFATAIDEKISGTEAMVFEALQSMHERSFTENVDCEERTYGVVCLMYARVATGLQPKEFNDQLQTLAAKGLYRKRADGYFGEVFLYGSTHAG